MRSRATLAVAAERVPAMKWKELVIIYRLPLQLNDGILPTVGDHNQQQKRDIELHLKRSII